MSTFFFVDFVLLGRLAYEIRFPVPLLVLVCAIVVIGATGMRALVRIVF